jgi:hypothetical protein
MHGHTRRWVIPIVAIVAIAGIVLGFYLSRSPSVPSPQIKPAAAATGACTPNAILVNPCRPWLGAAVGGNPGASTSAMAQFTYLEHLVGHGLDIYRDYHTYPGAPGPNSDPPLNSTEIYFATHGVYVDVNWNPSKTWQQALPVSQGGSPATNSYIAAVAANIKKIAPHKIFLSLWHETNLDVSGGTNCPHGGHVANAGTPAQYIAAYRNVWNTFKADGVTNVVWVMDYAGDLQRQCLVPQLWPGNSYVDWVIYDTYSHGKSWEQTSGRFYTVLENENSPSFDVDAKPWGIGEFGACRQSEQSSNQYYLSVDQAIQDNTYPRLKMYLIFADTGNTSGLGCLTDYGENGQVDLSKQAAFNQFANAPAFTK